MDEKNILYLIDLTVNFWEDHKMKTVKGAVAVFLSVAAVVSMGGCLKYTNNILDVTKATQTEETSGEVFTYNYTTEQYQTQPSLLPTEAETSVEQPVTSADVTPSATQPTVTQPTPVTPTQPQQNEQQKDPSGWTKAEILAYVTSAVNKSKAYMGKLTVGHKESFDVNIDNISVGGSLVKNTANSIIASVAKPTDETLTFVNGKTTTSEGETVPILLPKRQNFALTADGLASATASKSGNNTVINLKLVQETSSLDNPAPKYNAASCGYMSISDVELPSIVTVERLDMKYTGSTINLTVNSDGYVSSCTYTIPVIITGSGNVKVMAADFQVSAKIVEVWNLNW